MYRDGKTIIRRARYKVNSRFDGYWYVVFTDITDELKDKLDIRCVNEYNCWVAADEQYGDVAGSFCWENWVRTVDKEMIERWLG